MESILRRTISINSNQPSIKDNPDFYPLLAGAVDALAKKYGAKDLSGKLRELQQRDSECRQTAAIVPNRAAR